MRFGLNTKVNLVTKTDPVTDIKPDIIPTGRPVVNRPVGPVSTIVSGHVSKPDAVISSVYVLVPTIIVGGLLARFLF